MLNKKIQEIENADMPKLRNDFKLYFGWDCKARNKEFLRSRIIYRLQELEFGGLSSTIKYLLNTMAIPKDVPSLKSGMILERSYKGKNYRIDVGNNTFLMNGKHYESLSAIAYIITGQRISGNRFFNINK